MTFSLASIFRHPVKSVGSEALEKAELVPGGALVGDRAFAITHGASEWQDGRKQWMHCRNFLRIANAPRLAAISVAFDVDTRSLLAAHPDLPKVHADLRSSEGRRKFMEWIAPLAGTVQGPFECVEGTVFTDSSAQSPSIMSLASLCDLEAKMGVALDPRRFRGNLWIEGSQPWAELEWVGQELRVGKCRLRIDAPIKRCRATMANPVTGERDCDPVAGLLAAQNHTLFGVEASVVSGGKISVGDTLELQLSTRGET